MNLCHICTNMDRVNVAYCRHQYLFRRLVNRYHRQIYLEIFPWLAGWININLLASNLQMMTLLILQCYYQVIFSRLILGCLFLLHLIVPNLFISEIRIIYGRCPMDISVVSCG